MLARLLEAQPGVFCRIALFTIFDSEVPTPLVDFLNLFLVCHASYQALTYDCASLYFNVFAATFDILGPLSRLGKGAVEEHAEHELKRRFRALKVIRRGYLDDPDLTEAFWITYMMLEEADKGHKNVKQLFATGLYDLLNNFIRQRLYRGSETNSGWPIPNEQNSLAVALFWLSSSLRSLNRESNAQHEEVAQLLQPLVFAAFRYPIFSSAEFYFNIATYTHQPTASSVHGPYPPPPLVPRVIAYFGPVCRTMRVPSISLFATLSFFARKEVNPPAIPPHLYPESRNDDISVRIGPTLDDIRHFHDHCQTHFADFPGIDVGVIRGRVEAPPALCSPTLAEPSPYKLGALTGRWQGSFIVPYVDVYQNWLKTLPAPPEFIVPGRSPLYMSLQEHYICNPETMIPPGDISEGTKNAWLPAGFKWIQRENGIEVSDENGSFKSFYRTFQHGDDLPSGHVVDVIITGMSDPRHAAAWGDHKIVGRIRLQDGLIMLSRKPLTEDAGTNLLRGYVTSSQNFVGRFKGVTSGMQPAAWEAVFSLCRVRQA